MALNRQDLALKDHKGTCCGRGRRPATVLVYQHHHSKHSYPQKNLATAPDLRETVGTFAFHVLGKGRILRRLASGVL